MLKLRWLLVVVLPVIISSCRAAAPAEPPGLIGIQGMDVTVISPGGVEEPSPAAPSVSGEFKVIFDGGECSVTGPAEIPAGSRVFRFTNESGKSASLYLCRLDQGRTWEDVVDYIGEPGSPVPEAAWCRSILQRRVSVPEDPDAWVFPFEAGAYAVVCEQSEDPPGVWAGAVIGVRPVAMEDITGAWRLAGSNRTLTLEPDSTYGIASHPTFAENPDEDYGRFELDEMGLALIPDEYAASGCGGLEIVYEVGVNEQGQLVFAKVKDACGFDQHLEDAAWERSGP